MSELTEAVQLCWRKFDILFDKIESIEERLSNLEKYTILKEEDEYGWNEGTLKELRKSIKEQSR